MSEPRFLASVFLLASFTCELQLTTCPLAFWMSRADRLAGVLQNASSRPMAIDVVTQCRHEISNASLSERGVLIRTYRLAPLRLRRTLPKRSQPSMKIVTLLKWMAVSIVDVEFVIMTDMDMDLLIPRVWNQPLAIAADWLDTFERMRARGMLLASRRDHSSPVNAGLMIVRPSSELYEEGVALLSRNSPLRFNVSVGWDQVGAPSVAIPRNDSVWRSKPRQRLHMLNEDKWLFVGNNIDQGMFFHEFRVVREKGVDLGWLPEESSSSVWRNLSGSSQPPPVRYPLVHMFVKPWYLVGAECRPGQFTRRADTKRLRQLGKVLAYTSTAGDVFAECRDEAVMPEVVRQRCVATTNRTHQCALGEAFGGIKSASGNSHGEAARQRDHVEQYLAKHATLAASYTVTYPLKYLPW